MTTKERWNSVASDTCKEVAAELDAMKRNLEERMRELVVGNGSDADLLSKSMCAAALGGGKRLRPMLLMALARDLGCASPALINVACAVELVHTSSLVVDDMPCMDDARLRRGAPAIHVAFGQDVAILTSIALLSRAFHIVATAEDLAPLVRTGLVGALAEAIGTQGLAKGQFQDLHGAQARTAEEIALTNELKTGALLGATIDITAIICQSDTRVAKALRAFAFATGQAFQICDDLKDLPGNDSALTGKDVGLDSGKATLLTTLGVAEAKRRLRFHLQEAERHLDDAVGKQQRTRRLLGSFFADGGPVSGPRPVPRMATHSVGPAPLNFQTPEKS